ncbi:uncharacterized protein KZ484_008987 isoform 2-T2 [Pholidichthys leucotaenia]
MHPQICTAAGMLLPSLRCVSGVHCVLTCSIILIIAPGCLSPPSSTPSLPPCQLHPASSPVSCWVPLSGSLLASCWVLLWQVESFPNFVFTLVNCVVSCVFTGVVPCTHSPLAAQPAAAVSSL